MSKKPNILLLLSDQQSATMLSCTGNQYLHTPALDGLANKGVRFERAYCTDPVCIPSRFSIMTGYMAYTAGLRGNYPEKAQGVERFFPSGIGHRMTQAGYECVYMGKQHLPQMASTDLGFQYTCSDERSELAQEASKYLAARKDSDQPFFLVVSLINPHDICMMAIRDFASNDDEKHKVSIFQQEQIELDQALASYNAKTAPPLPENHLPQEDEPEAVRDLLKLRPFRFGARTHYGPEDWRRHRWAYCRLTETVDGQIREVLRGLERSGQEDETLVLFTSDHGDHDSAHRLEHKTIFYEEACRVPLIAVPPKQEAREPKVDIQHLVSAGLDILPTIADYAGLDPSEALPEIGALQGLSLRPLLAGVNQARQVGQDQWRSALLLQNESGFAVYYGDFLYVRYDHGENNEQLYHLPSNQGQTHNDLNNPQYQSNLVKLRSLYNNMVPASYQQPLTLKAEIIRR